MSFLRACLPAVLATLAAFSGNLPAQQVYKYVTPDGRVIYSDKPVKGAEKSKAVTVPPAPSQSDVEAAKRRAEQERKSRDAATARLYARRKALDAADARVTAARKALEDAENALELGREPLPGERTGTVSGNARLNERYFERVTRLEDNVERARRELDEALAERNQAR
jgi:hypothetical protein